MTLFWQAYITILSLGCWFFVAGVLVYVLRARPKLERDGTTGHVYDGIREFDKPMPRWWLFIFILGLIFGLIYCLLYPTLPLLERFGLSNRLKWSSAGEEAKATKANNDVFERRFNQYFAKESIEQLAQDPRAMKVANRLFLQNCAVCHGSSARGALGFPNLTDADWLYGGDAATITKTITEGRKGGMPAWKDKLGEDGVDAAAEYVLSLSGRSGLDPVLVTKGQTIFKSNCTMCHGPNGTGSYSQGNTMTGAPNLTDNIWLYGGERNQIRTTIRYGRAGQMPSWQAVLGPERIKLLASYVYSFRYDHQAPARH